MEKSYQKKKRDMILITWTVCLALVVEICDYRYINEPIMLIIPPVKSPNLAGLRFKRACAVSLIHPRNHYAAIK